MNPIERKQMMENARNFKGNDIVQVSGRVRALRIYSQSRPCEVCGKAKSERHHIDGDTRNNEESNIQFLCRRCHMAADGRLAKITETAPSRSAKVLEIRRLKYGK